MFSSRSFQSPLLQYSPKTHRRNLPRRRKIDNGPMFENQIENLKQRREGIRLEPTEDKLGTTVGPSSDIRGQLKDVQGPILTGKRLEIIFNILS